MKTIEAKWRERKSCCGGALRCPTGLIERTEHVPHEKEIGDIGARIGSDHAR